MRTRMHRAVIERDPCVFLAAPQERQVDSRAGEGKPFLFPARALPEGRTSFLLRYFVPVGLHNNCRGH